MIQLRMPEFLGVGAVKAGTTWLHDNLRAHPDLFLPLHKPVFYWDRNVAKPLARYSNLFRPGEGKMCGEFTAAYSVLPDATIDRIKWLVPDMKIIVLLREPKSRAWSEAKMQYSVVTPKKDVTEDEYAAFLESKMCVDRGDYVAILARWRSFFGSDRVFVDLYDDVRDDPKGLVARVLDFLGVSKAIDWDQLPLKETIFKGLERPMPSKCAAIVDRMYTRDAVSKMSDAAGIDLVRKWGYG